MLNDETVRNISIIFFNMGVFGSNAGSKEEKNKFKKYFDENNRLDLLLNLFEYLISQTLSPIQKETINWMSVGICFLFKNERPPLCYRCVLEYVNNLKSSPSPTSGYDFPSAAKKVWNQILYADRYIVDETFEVENGILGLERDMYLNIVKFLDSSMLRKVSKYFLFCLYFYLCFL
jgi:hypothetical protein